MVIGHLVEIETVPQRVARAALQLDETGVKGVHFTLKLANSGRTSVGSARFKSPLAHKSGTRCRLGTTYMVLAPAATDAKCNYPMPSGKNRSR